MTQSPEPPNLLPRRIAVYGVVLGCSVVFGVAVLAVVGLFLLSFSFGGVEREETDLSGPEAKNRLGGDWPAGVDPVDVQNVSKKYASSRDSYSTWYRIALSREAAATWQNHVHSREEQISGSALHHLHEGREGVHRTERGPPPLHQQTGATPAWWSPPKIDFRATEVMLWYKRFDSGVGRATYSAYDESTKSLWIYEYACQHDQLWSHGDVPAGQQFSTINSSDREATRAETPEN